MPLANNKKLPAPRRSHDKGALAATMVAKFCEITGSKIITGKVPITKPAMIKAPVAALPDIALAARAEDKVMHGKKTVANPNAKFLACTLRSRWPRCEIFAASRLITFGAKTNSRLSSNESPWAPRIVANVSESTIPALGRNSVNDSPRDPIIDPTAAPIKAYDITRPKLYRITPIQISRRPVPALENPPQTSGPHIAAQCHDITKLNHTIDKIVAAFTTSTECSRCQK
jgi:hypothetical protein